MNNTITLPQVITQLAKLTNTDSNTARLFLRAFFATIEKNLAAGETVVIKNVGTFKRADDPSLGSSESVLFAPDKAITDEINAPFAMFSAVELANGLSDNDLAEAEPQPEPAPEPEPASEETAPAPEPEVAAAEPAAEEPLPEVTELLIEEETPATVVEPPLPAPEPTPVSEPEPMSEPERRPEPAQVVNPAVAPIVPPAPEPAEIEDEPEEMAVAPQRKKSHVWLWAAIIVLLAAVGGYFAAVYAVPDFEWDDEAETEVTDQEIAAEALPEIDVDQAAIEARNQADVSDASMPAAPAPEVTAEKVEAPAAPAQSEPKYDTVTSKRFLSTMAREYYGQNIFWVYIYEANKDHLGDPNKISAGTRVVIPDKSSLPKASSTTEAVRMAEKKAAEIQARFRK